jgi:predicted outer membrane repeat protein
MFSMVLIGLFVIFSYGMGNVAAANTSTIYVNGSSGQDNWDGQLAVWNGTSGPKATIKNATGTVSSDGTVYIANGIYNESNIQLNNNMTIIGETQQNTIINGLKSGQSIFIINDKINVTISNLTMEDGQSGNGGAICSMGNFNIINCTFTNNTASNAGGAICGGNIYTTGCTFTNNTASNAGGAICGGNIYTTGCTFTNNTAANCGGAISGDENIYVTDCNFTNNTATSNSGGAISDEDGLSVTGCTFTSNNAANCGGAISDENGLNVTNSTFINNTARLGGAICNDGTAEVNFNRILGITATSNDIVSGGSINTDNNWWGSNQGPSTSSVEGLTVTKWLVLSVTKNSSTIIPGQTSTISANLLYDNGILNDPNNPELYYHDPSNGCVPDGIPVTFSGYLGSVNPINTTLTEGLSQAIFTPNNSGSGNITATVDNQSVSAPIMIGPPTIDSINPTNNSSTNNIGKVITITFNVPIVSGSSYNDITVTGPSGIVSTTSQINGNILTLTPTSSYINGNYYVNIPINAVTDLAGNNLTTTYNSNFTVDTVPPTVKTITPIKNAINIPTNQVIKITFSKAIKAGNMNITLTNSSGAPVTISTSINGNILTINHKALLTNGKYTLTLHTGSITDLTGNPLAIVGSSFTVDSIPPTVKTITPVKNAIKIPTNQIIKITFSESIKAGNMAIELKTSTGKEILFTRTISGNTLTIKPKSLLSKGIKYTLILHTGCVTDLASNNLTAYSSCFTTV